MKEKKIKKNIQVHNKSKFKFNSASYIGRHAKSYMRVKSMYMFVKVAYSDLLAKFANI